jgi:hypothetical protein
MRDEPTRSIDMIVCEPIEITSPTRELAQRRSGTEEILLLWYPTTGRVAISIRDVTTGAGYHLEVDRGRAIDAFYHPYAYVTSSEHSNRVLRTVATIDGE